MSKPTTLIGLQTALGAHYRNEHGFADVRIVQTSRIPRYYCLTVHPAIPADLLHDPSAPLWGPALFTCVGSKTTLLAELAEPATRPLVPNP